MKDKISKLISVYKKDGFKVFFKKCCNYINSNYFDKVSLKVLFNKGKYKDIIHDILNNSNYDRIIIWRSTFGYNVPLFQRPQHIANNLAKNRCLVFYEVTTMTDKVKLMEKLNDNLYLFNFNNRSLSKILNEEIINKGMPRYVEIYSTDWKMSINELINYLDNGYKLIYEYIDHLSAELSGTKNLPKNILDKYNYVMEHDNTYVVATADALMDEVIKKRGKKNLVYSSNGVDYNFFKSFDEEFSFDADFNKVLSIGKPIVMYYGALANWVDYDLIKSLAKTNKYSIVLFGVKYDSSFDDNLKSVNNVFFLGKRDYKVLKNYARCADVLMIPFKINDITKSTNPVKIFEYMALHKPIVTTNMPECRKYKSVMIGHDKEEFIELIAKAMDMRVDSNYIKLLDKEALENDWSKKAKAIVDMIKKDE